MTTTYKFPSPQTANKDGKKKKGGGGGRGEDDKGKKKKQKNSKAEFSLNQPSAFGLPVPQEVLDMPVDPNEPTYCLCQQVLFRLFFSPFLHC